jgi:hypothetical protein
VVPARRIRRIGRRRRIARFRKLATILSVLVDLMRPARRGYVRPLMSPNSRRAAYCPESLEVIVGAIAKCYE